MQLTQSQRDEMVERLTRDMCDTIQQWVLNDWDSLYSFVADVGNYRKQSDEELADEYSNQFDELPEGVDEDN